MMEEMSLQEFEAVLISAGVIVKNQPDKWEDILNRLSMFYDYAAEEERIENRKHLADYYKEISDKLYKYLCDRKYFD